MKQAYRAALPHDTGCVVVENRATASERSAGRPTRLIEAEGLFPRSYPEQGPRQATFALCQTPVGALHCRRYLQSVPTGI